MPTYEYFCETNTKTVEVLHSMNHTIETWGELCACSGMNAGETPNDTPVEKKFSAVSLLPKKGVPMETGGGGCCGGGCGCSH